MRAEVRTHKSSSAGPPWPTGNAGPPCPTGNAGPLRPTKSTEGRDSRSQTRRGELPRCLLPAFTLAELMIVVAIMALLISIMLPALGKARQHAKTVASSAVLSAIGTGLEMFKAEGNLGGDYPPSYSDADGTSGGIPLGAVRDPYEAGSSTTWINEMSGAGLLLWALAGADQLGTPGFKAFRDSTVSDNPRQLWSVDTGSGPPGTDYTTTNCQAYKLREDDQRPVHPRYGPYLDLSKIQITPFESNADGQGFVIEAETNARGVKTYRRYPLFLDTFGSPILYWKADPAGNQAVDKSRRDPASAGASRGIYHWEDNWALLDSEPALNPGRLILRDGDQGEDPATTRSALYWDDAWAPAMWDFNPTTADKDPPPPNSFPYFVGNANVTARLTPYRPDSYLLVSPGYDGRYGTADDVTNFPSSANK